MNFDWSVFTNREYLLFLSKGAALTLFVSIISQIFGLALGLSLAILRVTKKGKIAVVVNSYIWFFRGVPLLILLILVFNGLPQIGIRFSAFTASVIALSLYSSAYIAEIINAGISSVDQSQVEAARLDGSTELQALTKIILPQAFRFSIAPVANEFIAMIKNSSLASAISLLELSHRTTLLISSTFKALEFYTLTAILYLLATSLFSVLQRKLENRYSSQPSNL